MSVELHRQAEGLMDEADTLLADGRKQDAVRLYYAAAQLEDQVFLGVPKSRPRTRGIVAISAVNLYWKADAYSDAIRVAHKYLTDSNLAPAAEDELEELIQIIRREKQAAQAGISVNRQPMTVSLKGSDVENGIAPVSLVILKLEQFRNYGLRVAEHAARKPFRKIGPVAGDVLQSYNLAVSQPVAGSFKFGFTVETPLQLPLPLSGEVEFTPDSIASQFFGILDAIVKDEVERFEERVSDPQYREVFLRHVSNLAPDGRGVSRIEVTRTTGRDVQVALLTPDVPHIVKQHLPRRQRRDGTKEVTRTGVLRALDLNEGWIELSEPGSEQKCYIGEDKVFDDVVGPFVNRRVMVPGHWESRRFILHDVILDTGSSGADS